MTPNHNILNMNQIKKKQNKNNYSAQFPIMPSQTDKKYDMHLKKIDEELNSADTIIPNPQSPKRFFISPMDKLRTNY